MSQKQKKIFNQNARLQDVNAKISQTMKLSGILQEEVDKLKAELDHKNQILNWFGWTIFVSGLAVLGLDIIQGWLLGTENFSFTYNPGIGRQQLILAGVSWVVSLILISTSQGRGREWGRGHTRSTEPENAK